MSRFFFSFYPTHEKNPKRGRATHYTRNNGIITLNAELALYIANCIRHGDRPKLFAQGWSNRRDDTFNVGLEIPRRHINQTEVEQEQPNDQNSLLNHFEL